MSGFECCSQQFEGDFAYPGPKLHEQLVKSKNKKIYITKYADILNNISDQRNRLLGETISCCNAYRAIKRAKGDRKILSINQTLNIRRIIYKYKLQRGCIILRKNFLPTSLQKIFPPKILKLILFHDSI